MVNLDSKELKMLEYVGGGGFGRLYRKENLVYKIYNSKVNSLYGGKVSNPSLRYNSF